MNQTKSIPKESVGISARQELNPKLAEHPLSTQLSTFHMELQLQLCFGELHLGGKLAGEFSQKFLLIWTNLWVVPIGSRYIFCAAHEHRWCESTQGR